MMKRLVVRSPRDRSRAAWPRCERAGTEARPYPGRGKAIALLVALALATSPTVALAAGPSKVVTALINAAQKEFDAGNFERAGQLFLEIFKQDATQIAALYNAARGFHLGRRFVKAEELYRQLLALPSTEAPLKAKVEGQLVDIQNQRADVKVEEAVKAEEAGNFALAVQLWGDAVRMGGRKLPWVLRMARAKQLAGQKDAALKEYDAYLAETPEDDKGRVDAARWRAEIAPATYDDVPVPRDAPVVKAVVVEAPSRWPAYATLGGGVALAAAGLGLYVATQGDVSNYDAKMAASAGGMVTGWSLQEANAERDRINGRVYVSWGLAGVGAVVAGVGAWLLVRAPGATVAVTPQGVLIAGRF